MAHMTAPRGLGRPLSASPAVHRAFPGLSAAIPRSSQRRHDGVVPCAARHRPYGRPYGAPGPQPGPQGKWQPPSAAAKEKEPFDTELLILFGLPTVCIILPWVLSEPEALVLLAPFLLLIPGPRDVLRSVATEAMAGMAKAQSFTGDQQEQQQQRGSSGYSSSSSGSYDGPPPPPPSRQWAYGRPGSSSSAPAEPSAWEAPAWGDVPDGTPSPGSTGSYPSGGREAYYPPTGQQPSTGYEELPQQPFSAGAQPPQAAWDADSRAAGPRGSGMLARSVAAAAGSSGRLVRSGGRGRVGVDISTQAGGGAPGWLGVLLRAFPFLRSWGGFM